MFVFEEELFISRNLYACSTDKSKCTRLLNRDGDGTDGAIQNDNFGNEGC